MKAAEQHFITCMEEEFSDLLVFHDTEMVRIEQYAFTFCFSMESDVFIIRVIKQRDTLSTISVEIVNFVLDFCTDNNISKIRVMKVPESDALFWESHCFHAIGDDYVFAV